MPEDKRHTRGGCTASDFANWVFQYTHPNYYRFERESSTHALQEMGRATHQWIESIKKSVMQLPIALNLSKNWKLIYSDPHDGTDEQLFLASRLTVDGEPMRCKPDVVFRDDRTESVIVVERKVTSRHEETIPSEAWPNIRAQLWAYGWIDDWLAAPEVLLVCNFYRRNLQKTGYLTWQSRSQPWALEQTVQPFWRRSNRDFHEECLGYFKQYGGTFS
jgi:hypothetical protein